MTTTTTLFVPGTPAPQGSKKFVGMRNGKPILVEQSDRVGPWRRSVAHAARFVHPQLLVGAVAVRLDFVMPRPKTAKPDVVVPATKRTGDIDKLARSCLDALTGSALVDDSQVTELHATKRVAAFDEAPGVRITLTTQEDQ